MFQVLDYTVVVIDVAVCYHIITQCLQKKEASSVNNIVVKPVNNSLIYVYIYPAKKIELKAHSFLIKINII